MYKIVYKIENEKKVKYVKLTFIDYTDEFDAITIEITNDDFLSGLRNVIWEDIEKKNGICNAQTIDWFMQFLTNEELFELYSDRLYDEFEYLIKEKRNELRKLGE